MSDPTDFEQITYDVADHIATITLNRPDKLNAFTALMAMELLAAFDLSDADDDVRAVIVTGAGRGFCAGADLSEGGASFSYAENEQHTHRDGGGLVTLRMFESLKPIIGAINGPAVGIGATMTLPMDVRLASTHARFGFVFARRGIVPEAASSWFLPRLVGMPTALDWCLSGRLIDATEAQAAGLVQAVHEPGALIDAALALASKLTEASAPVSVAATRRMLWRMAGAPHPGIAHSWDSRMVRARGASGDAAEGVASFLEKRAAIFPDSVARDYPHFSPFDDEPGYE